MNMRNNKTLLVLFCIVVGIAPLASTQSSSLFTVNHHNKELIVVDLESTTDSDFTELAGYVLNAFENNKDNVITIKCYAKSPGDSKSPAVTHLIKEMIKAGIVREDIIALYEHTDLPNAYMTLSFRSKIQVQ